MALVISLFLCGIIIVLISGTKSKSIFHSPEEDYQEDYGYNYIEGAMPKCSRIWNYFGTHMHLGQNENYGDLGIYNFIPTAIEIRSGCFLTMVDDQGTMDKIDTSVVAGGRSKCWLRPLSLACCECFGCYGAKTPSENACAIVYEHGYCSACIGKTLNVQEEDVPLIHPMMDRSISSIIVRPGCVLEVFKMANFNGEGAAVSGIMDVLDQEWNDEIASYRCKCGSSSNLPNATTPYPGSSSTTKKTSLFPVTQSTTLTTTTTTSQPSSTEKFTTPTKTTPTTKQPTSSELTTTTTPPTSSVQTSDRENPTTTPEYYDMDDTTETFIIY